MNSIFGLCVISNKFINTTLTTRSNCCANAQVINAISRLNQKVEVESKAFYTVRTLEKTNTAKINTTIQVKNLSLPTYFPISQKICIECEK